MYCVVCVCVGGGGGRLGGGGGGQKYYSSVVYCVVSQGWDRLGGGDTTAV